MEQAVTIVERKPFHEAVVSMIQQASREELTTIGTLLIKTKIPKGHDEIVRAWTTRCLEMGWADASIRYVGEDVLLHKRQLEAAKVEKESNPQQVEPTVVIREGRGTPCVDLNYLADQQDYPD